MITTHQLLDAAKAAAGISSEYRLCRTVGVSDQCLRNWRLGRSSPDDERAARLAEMAGLDVGYVLASMAAERAKDEGLKAAWAGLAKRLEGIAAALVLAILANIGAVSFDRGALASTGIEAPSAAKMAISRVIHRGKCVARSLHAALHRFLASFSPIAAPALS